VRVCFFSSLVYEFLILFPIHIVQSLIMLITSKREEDIVSLKSSVGTRKYMPFLVYLCEVYNIILLLLSTKTSVRTKFYDAILS